MRKSIKEAIREILQALIDNGSEITFTQKELKELGVKVKGIKCNA